MINLLMLCVELMTPTKPLDPNTEPGEGGSEEERARRAGPSRAETWALNGRAFTREWLITHKPV